VVLRTRAGADAQAFTAHVKRSLSARARCYTIPDDADALPGLLSERKAEPDAPVTAYFCNGHQCSAPTTDAAAFAASLEN
jgi:uncharacterized protein YyaL (SSP411 family)